MTDEKKPHDPVVSVDWASLPLDVQEALARDLRNKNKTSAADAEWSELRLADVKRQGAYLERLTVHLYVIEILWAIIASAIVFAVFK